MASAKTLSNKDMNGLKVTNLGAPSNGTNDAARKVDVESAYTAAISRANHTGTQTASTISDFDTQVRTSRLDQMAVPTATVNLNSQRLASVADPTSAQDASTKNYVDTAVAGLVSGQTLKGPVRVAVSTNVTLTAPGASLDGVTLTNGDIVLLMGQTDPTQNGPYTWTGSAATLTRAPNWNTNAQAVLGSYWIVREGTKADSFALLTTDTAITLGTTSLAFTVISVAGAAIGRYAANSPAVAAGATWTVTHNLGSTDVIAVVKRVASPYDEVDVYWSTSDANTVLVQPDIAMASGEYRVVIKY